MFSIFSPVKGPQGAVPQGEEGQVPRPCCRWQQRGGGRRRGRHRRADEPRARGGEASATAPPQGRGRHAGHRQRQGFRNALQDNTDFDVQQDDANFIDDGIEIEPFNLEQEREEGYFDENGNFVEFARGNDMKDAWLDNVEVDTKFAGKVQKKKDKEEEFQDLSSDDIGKIKRRIANMLEPAETIIQALKRLKSTSTDNRGRMTEGTKRIFDELTEAAMKLMENGEYNVYSDDQETFVREAEGYERLARSRLGIPEVEEDIFADATESGPTTTSLLEMDSGPSAANTSATTAIANDDDSNFDMFGENDDTDVNPDSDAKTLDSDCNPEPVPQEASGTSGAEKVGNGSADSDYVYDPSSGYYYSSRTGYYYDAASGCYCAASTGTWYSYDEQSGTYTEMHGEQTGMHKEIEGEVVKE
ncbi:hypothetical protein CFC21_077492 [Triticum aestivum]|uniref:OCRE domain-containing protein n=2 Tax=Triticum aestivum TaxID=4565 RepID=A0A3B6MRA9_WHEAT|nr:hypothetical protein CFC21_077492 [Triticum aestivum]